MEFMDVRIDEVSFTADLGESRGAPDLVGSAEGRLYLLWLNLGFSKSGRLQLSLLFLN